MDAVGRVWGAVKVFRYLLEVFNLDKNACAKLRRLLLLVPLGAIASFLLLRSLPDTEAALKIFVVITGGCFFTVMVCNIYGKMARLLTWPWVKFSDMPQRGQMLFLAIFGSLFLVMGFVIGISAEVLTSPRWDDPPKELLEGLPPLTPADGGS